MNGIVTPPVKPGKNPLNLSKLSDVAKISVERKLQDALSEMIDLSLIDVEKQSRESFTEIEDLAEAIKKSGQLQAIIVTPRGNGRYLLIAGERRVRAITLLGRQQIEAKILHDLNDVEKRAIQVGENKDREPLTPFEEANAVCEDVLKFGAKAAAEIWRKSDTWISKRMGTRRYAQPVFDLFAHGECNDIELLHLLNQAYEADEAHADFLLFQDRIQRGEAVSRDDVRSAISRMKLWNDSKKAAQQPQLQGLGNQPVEPEVTDNAPGVTATGNADSDEEVVWSALGNGNNDAGQHAEDHQPASSPAPEDTKQEYLPDLKPSPEERAKAATAAAQKKLHNNRCDVVDWGQNNQGLVNGMKTHMATLGLDVPDSEWVLWHTFLAMTLPLLEGIGPERAELYTKKLAAHLKKAGPMEVWQELHQNTEPGQPYPNMPENWRL